jgi:predicted lipoprotein with Yx(FWY)xxD motif
MHGGIQSGRFPTRRSSLRVAAVTLAVGTLSSSVLIGGMAAAVSSHKVKHVVVSTRTSKYGTILVSGKTLYIIKSASKFPCTGKCLKIWPALLLPKGVTKATAGSGVNAATLGTVMHKGGSVQVTYAGKPLYWFYKDTAPGQVNGNISDKWGTWSVVVMNPAGAAPLTGSTVPQGSTTPSTPSAPSTPSTMNPNTTSNTNAPPVTTPPTAPPVTTPPTAPPVTTPPTTTPTTSPPTTTTTSPGGGGVGF